MKTFMSRAVLASLLLGASMMASAATPAPAGAKAFIVTPENGATVDKTFKVKFGIEGVALAPAGDATKNTGHHHLLIDTELPNADEPIPNDRQHLHFGAGETETMIELPPGKHTLQLLLGDENHIPHTPFVKSKKITITVR